MQFNVIMHTDQQVYRIQQNCNEIIQVCICAIGNTIQELKGNIRVFCRVRPLVGSEAATAQFHCSAASKERVVSYPNKDPEGRQLMLRGQARKSNTGQGTLSNPEWVSVAGM